MVVAIFNRLLAFACPFTQPACMPYTACMHANTRCPALISYQPFSGAHSPPRRGLCCTTNDVTGCTPLTCNRSLALSSQPGCRTSSTRPMGSVEVLTTSLFLDVNVLGLCLGCDRISVTLSIDRTLLPEVLVLPHYSFYACCCDCLRYSQRVFGSITSLSGVCPYDVAPRQWPLLSTLLPAPS